MPDIITAPSNWDFTDLARRLQGARKQDFSALDGLLEEAAVCIHALMETNRSLNRRAQQVESEAAQEKTAKELARAVRELSFYRGSWRQSFQRMGNAHREIERIYEHLRRAKPDDAGPGYHSVMDSRADGGQFDPGTVWANVFKHPNGIVSVRPAEIVGPLIDELLARRKGESICVHCGLRQGPTAEAAEPIF